MSRSSNRFAAIAGAAAAIALIAAAVITGAQAADKRVVRPVAAAPAKTVPFGYGRAAKPEEIKGWDIDVRGDDGLGLPPGKGSVKDGEALYQEKCAGCHGEFAEGNGRWPELAGGAGTLKSDNPRKTIGSYWPYAPTVFDYVKRAMPFNAPQSLSDDEVYSIVAYLLNLNELLPEDATLDAKSLAALKLPNRNGFISEDPRPDVPELKAGAEPCMQHCRTEPVKVTSDLAQSLGVTPENRPKE